MTNSASSERLHKQFCQTHISTIDRPERRQAEMCGNGLTPWLSPTKSAIAEHETSIKAAITSAQLERPLATRLPRGNHTDWLDRHPKNAATSDNFDEKTEKPLSTVTNFQSRGLLRFALRLKPSILEIE